LETETANFAYVSFSFSPERGGDLRGYIDEFDLRKGIRGWAISLSNPTNSLTLEILLGSKVIAQCQTTVLRKDIAKIVGADATAGFHFSHEAIQTLWECVPTEAHERIAIRFAGTSFLLPSRAPLPTLAEAFSVPEPIQTLPAAPGFDTPKSKLISQLAETRNQTIKSLRPFPYQQAGFIEGIAFEEAGWIWASGWTLHAKNCEGMATIIDGGKQWPAAVTLVFYEREDLGSNAAASAFLALIHTDWVPDLNADISFIFNADNSFRLSFSPAPRLKGIDEFFQLFQTKRNRITAGKTDDFHRLIQDWQSWRPSSVLPSVATIRPSLEAAVEQVLILPGFGCLVTGWAVSTIKTIESFSLKLGSTIMPCDPRSLYFKPRNDLEKGFPRHDKVISNAGFTAVFRGDVSATNVASPVLKMTFTDGSSHNVGIDLKLLRQLGKTTRLDAACDLYPALTSEIFFPEFAAAVRTQSSLRKHLLKPYEVQATSRAIVFAAPEDRGELFLLFDELQQFARQLPPSVGLVILAQESPQRSLTTLLFNDFLKDSTTSASLFFIDDLLNAFYALPEILSELGTANFTFVGPHIFLTSEGWEAISRYLIGNDDTLHFFEVMDPAVIDEDAGYNSAQCFGWTTDALRQHLSIAPYHIGAFIDKRPLPCDPASETSQGSAWFSRLPILTPLSIAINELVEKV